MTFNLSCTASYIKIDFPLQLWEAQVADGVSANTFVTRFLHNKLLFLMNNLLRCQLSYLSPDFINKQFSLLGLVLFLLGIWHLAKKGAWIPLVVLVIAPLAVVFNIPSISSLPAVILYGVELMVIAFGLKELLEIVRSIFNRKKV